MDKVLAAVFLAPHKLPVSPTTCLWLPFFAVCLVRAWRAILADYNLFLSLGPGGTPSTPAGYLRICMLRLITIRNPLQAPEPLTSIAIKPFFGYENQLSRRKLPRPQLAGIAPQRQMTQRASTSDVRALHEAFYKLVKENEAQLRTGQSFFEKHSLAIFLASTTTIASNQKVVKNARLGSQARAENTPQEVAHLHGCDGSLHLTLHPRDVKTLIEKGWGERHPLAGRWVPSGFVLVYAPRSKEELEIAMSIVKASAWWVSEGRANVRG